MAGSDDKRLGEIESRLHREDPRFARELGAGRPCRQRSPCYEPPPLMPTGTPPSTTSVAVGSRYPLSALQVAR